MLKLTLQLFRGSLFGKVKIAVLTEVFGTFYCCLLLPYSCSVPVTVSDY
jgi:hypothetical protein